MPTHCPSITQSAIRSPSNERRVPMAIRHTSTKTIKAAVTRAEGRRKSYSHISNHWDGLAENIAMGTTTCVMCSRT